MALPKIKQKIYETHLKGIDKTVNYRGFTVKEENILRECKDSKDQLEIYKAVTQILNNCTLDKIDVEELPFFDAEELFMRIRSKSVGEVVTKTFKLKGTDKKVNMSLNLDEVEVQVTQGHTKTIQLTSDPVIGVVMKYPTLKMAMTIKDQQDIVMKCVECIYDEEEAYNIGTDTTLEELKVWFEDLDSTQSKLIKKFFDTMPCLKHELNVPIEEGKSEKYVLKGLKDFFM